MSLAGTSLKCRNLKSFSDRLEGFDDIKLMNIIIGRNNTGKSTLLDLVAHAAQDADLSSLGHKGAKAEAELAWEITDELVNQHLGSSRESVNYQGGSQSFSPQKWARGQLIGSHLVAEITRKGKVSFSRFEGQFARGVGEDAVREHIGRDLVGKFGNPFSRFSLRRIAADRDVRPETSGGELAVDANGDGVTRVLERFVNQRGRNRDLVEQTLRDHMNSIFRPDAEYDRLLLDETNAIWELLLEEKDKGRVPMSATGSGLKTVLLVLVNLLLVPHIGGQPRPLSEWIFCFEELENNLHPAVQRRLFRYLRETAIRDKCVFFITTHSNVVIDQFASDENAQILHVIHDGKCATVTTVATLAQGRHVLDDLDVRASDLLQTNVVVWVEGPSDRLFFNRWIELWDSELREGIHYQCLAFGGSLNAHLSYSDELVGDMIEALKINRHAILLVDSDQRQPGDPLKEHTDRLLNEVAMAGGLAWVTQGKEVENYIPAEALQTLAGETANSLPGPHDSVIAFYKACKARTSDPRKVDVAEELLPLLTRDGLQQTLDLAVRMDSVCRQIRQWNRLGSESLPSAPLVR